MGAMHLVFLIFSLTTFSPIANSHDAVEIFLKTTLEKAGLTMFSSLIAKTGVLKAYAEADSKKGLTVFAPSDLAFNPNILAALKTLTPEQVVKLLKYHALGGYVIKVPKDTPFPTLATDGDGTYTLKMIKVGRAPTLVAGESAAQILFTIFNAYPLAIYKIDNLLLPTEIFGKTPVPESSPSSENIKSILGQAGLTTFTSLIMKTGVIDVYQAVDNKKGVTIFAPSDSAFSPLILAALKNLASGQVEALLKHHAVGDYFPLEKLKATKGPISTLATNDNDGKYTLKASTDIGDDVIVVAGENLSLIKETVTDSNPLVIYKIEKVLLPSEIFGKSLAPAVSTEIELV